MNDATQTDNTARFTGLAEVYEKFRPTYPAEALAAVRAYWAETPGVPRLLADIGGGTGISTRAMMAALGDGGGDAWTARVVEPNGDMRAQASAALADRPDVSVVKGEAEALPFDDGTVGLLLAAQAAHWFDRPRFYADAARVLAPGGVMVILYNNRDLYGDPLMAAFETEVETSVEGYWRNYRSWNLMAELHALDWARDVTETVHPWTWRLTPEGFAGLMLSRSKMAPYKEVHGEDAARAAILDIAHRHADAEGMVGVRYNTQAACVRR
ncbi:class I SAM-dependent methyltransferase [Thalassospiraceae bacterium LMO-SO8]|nr:class I SAM-dependent methyltransferase [Alphaproteobacteria bacterium LMO-S08]WND74362.1 class I SAM-dependent methyltransferase [Thalassospiraceae bacterium LMO-SO8]